MNSQEPRTAATVVLIRDAEAGPEVLLLRRNKALMFAGGLWVFPGGSLDQEDWDAADGDEERAARIAATREAEEEAGIDISSSTLVQVSHWTTPVAEPKRFYTWIFLGLASAATAVTIDGGEIHDYTWVPIEDAIRQHEAGAMGMLPPTIMTLRYLRGYLRAEDAMIGIAARDPFNVFPVFAGTPDLVQVMFEGDAGYASGDADVDGPRHRAKLVDGCWEYVFEGQSANQPRLDS